MEADAYDAYLRVRGARADGGAWDEGYWKGVKATANRVAYYFRLKKLRGTDVGGNS